MKRLDSGVKRGGSSTRNANGSSITRHRRLASSAHKQTKGTSASWILKLVVPFLGLGSLGLVVVITSVCNVTRLDARRDSDFTHGFGYNDGGSLRGMQGDYHNGEPLRTPMVSRGISESSSKFHRQEEQEAQQQQQQQQLEDERRHQGSPRPNPASVADLGPPQSAPPNIPQQPAQGRGGDSQGAGRSRDDGGQDAAHKPKKSFYKSRPAGASDGANGGGGGGRRRGYGEWMGGMGIVARDGFETAFDSQRFEDFGDKNMGGGAVIINADEVQKKGLGAGRAPRQEAQEPVVPLLGRDAALLIICANRANFLERTLRAVKAHHPGSTEVQDQALPVLISQDGDNNDVEAVISAFKASMEEIAPVVHIKHTPSRRETRPYHKLSEHYTWALQQAFDTLHQDGYDHALVDKVIILEEDLEIAPDFFDYFSAMAPLLDVDESLMAVSAWNDNGQADRVKDNTVVVRSDFFPGLGWMLPRRVWDELGPKWPAAYWDDWLRDPQQRKDRQFIRPEVCRTYHFGNKGGASSNQFGSFLENIKLNDVKVPFREMDWSHLEPQAFHQWFGDRIRKAPTASAEDVTQGRVMPKEVLLEYDGGREFSSLARDLKVMPDLKAGVPRTAYMGVVSLWYGDTKVHIAPHNIRRLFP